MDSIISWKMKTTLFVPDLICPNCARFLEKLPDMLPGVMKANADYQTHILVVEFDETRLSADLIVRAVAQIGYSPQLL